MSLNETELLKETVFEVETFTLEDGRVGCSVPFLYPDGDYATVYIAASGDEWEVTDYGEALMVALGLGVELDALKGTAEAICDDFGLSFKEGRVTVTTTRAGIGEHVWFVAQASVRVAHAAHALSSVPQGTPQ